MSQHLHTTIDGLTRSLHRLRYAQVNSDLLRRALGGVYREGGIYRVPFGPLAGARLQYDPSISFHLMLGLGEMESFDVLSRALRVLVGRRPTVAYDVGANIGIYALWLSRALGPGSVVYAFEPSPGPFARLSRHVALNRAHAIHPVPMALSDHDGEVAFYVSRAHHSTSSLDPALAGGDGAERISVAATTLDSFCASGAGPSPDLIKVDIEGGGVTALKGFDGCVARKAPLMLIESHSPGEDRAISDLILAHDYQAYRLNNRRWVRSLATTHPDPEGVWGTVLLCPARDRERLEPALAGGRSHR